MQMKKISKVKVLSLILTLVMLITLNTRAIFASEKLKNGSTGVTVVNRETGSNTLAYVGHTLEVQLNSSIKNYSIEWYTTKEESGDMKDERIDGQNSTSLSVTADMNYSYVFCKIEDLDDSTKVIQSNKIYICYQNDNYLYAEKLKVGQIIPKSKYIFFDTLYGIGYDYSCFQYKVTDFVWTNSHMVYNHSEDLIVINIETFPKDSGGWQGNEVDISGNPVKGKSVYKIDLADYVPYDVTHSLDKITATSDTAGEKKAVNKLDYKTTLTPAKGYNLPKEITVNIGGNPAILDTDYTYNSKTGEVVVKGDKITGDITIIANGHVHTYGEWVKEDDVNHIRTCSCGEVESATHNWNDGEITTKPTTLAEGVKTFTCTDCHGTKTEAVAKLPTEVPSTEKPEDHVVQTGDYSNIIIWGTLLVVASGVVVALKRNKLSK